MRAGTFGGWLVIGNCENQRMEGAKHYRCHGVHFAKENLRAQTARVNLPVSFNDLALGDAKSAEFDLSRFQIDRIRSSSDPLFESAYEKLWAEFGEKGEMESRETLGQRFRQGPAMLYEIILVRFEEKFAAVHDHTAIIVENKVVIHLSHILIAPEWRRTGLAGWIRALPLAAGRECALADGLSPECEMILVAEMEYASGNDPQQTIRLRSYEKAGYLKVDPRVFKYHQPDFRPPGEIDAVGGARPLSLQLLLQFRGNGVADRPAPLISGAALRQVVEALYRMYGAQFRAEDMAHPALSLEALPPPGASIKLVPPTFIE